MRCGLLGGKLGHSYSLPIHKLLGTYPYILSEKKPEELSDFLTSGDFTGLNVTIPYKKEVIPYCAQLTERAKALGAVNTLVRQADGSLLGHNTDYFGFASMLERSGLQVRGKKVLVLGSGGASVTVVAVLNAIGAHVVVISRTGPDNYGNLCKHVDAAAIVNTTPVGMYPNNGSAPVDLSLFPNLEGVLDLIYNPARTQLLMDAEQRGLIAENGLWMLVAQAKESAEWFTASSIDDGVIADIHRKLRQQMENVILIGMPGCGKSTVGIHLAQEMGKTFVDADAEIEAAAGMSIPEIFAREGEASFRARETAVLSELGKRSGLVIATGGGCVTRQENYPLLRQNGTIVWLQRDLAMLPTNGRPLSQKGSLHEMYATREPMYRHFADVKVSNCNSVQETTKQILEVLP